ncbi:MAG: sulfite exporter TauE/SafE family protein, partial [Thermoanaerobacteraceae bacterium]
MKLFFIGILSGIIGGMGLGGGTILIPALTIFAGIEQHLAQSINLLSF